MAYSISTYGNIKGMLVGRRISIQTLDILKQDFAGEINSKRRLACVTSLADLVDILERRDVINEANVSILQDICCFLSDKELIDAISHYKLEEEYELENEYALERIQHEMEESKLVEDRKKGPLRLVESSKIEVQEKFEDSAPAEAVLSGEKRDEVFDLIAKEIGREWRSFGRGIGIRGGEMYDLEKDYHLNSEEKIRKMLEMFEEKKNVEPTEMVSCICTALVKCRRKDLCRQIQKILTS